MPLFSLRITLCGKNVQAIFRSMWHETYDGNTTEITLQFIPVVAIINAQNLVLYGTYINDLRELREHIDVHACRGDAPFSEGL